jgi:hypothetical protein
LNHLKRFLRLFLSLILATTCLAALAWLSPFAFFLIPLIGAWKAVLCAIALVAGVGALASLRLTIAIVSASLALALIPFIRSDRMMTTFPAARPEPESKRPSIEEIQNAQEGRLAAYLEGSKFQFTSDVGAGAFITLEALQQGEVRYALTKSDRETVLYSGKLDPAGSRRLRQSIEGLVSLRNLSGAEIACDKSGDGHGVFRLTLSSGTRCWTLHSEDAQAVKGLRVVLGVIFLALESVGGQDGWPVTPDENGVPKPQAQG